MKKIHTMLVAVIFLFTASSLSAYEWNDCCHKWLIRVRAIHLWPDDSSGELSTVDDSGVRIGSSTMPEVDFTYMFTQNWGAELILETSRHTINGRKALSGIKVATGWIVPPTLLLQYHFCPCSWIKPYVGAGINYTLTYNEKSKLDNTKVRLDNSFGFAGQAGVDFLFCDNWFFNLDLKYVDIELKAKLRGETSGHVHIDVNPWILGAGIGRRF